MYFSEALVAICTITSSNFHMFLKRSYHYRLSVHNVLLNVFTSDSSTYTSMQNTVLFVDTNILYSAYSCPKCQKYQSCYCTIFMYTAPFVGSTIPSKTSILVNFCQCLINDYFVSTRKWGIPCLFKAHVHVLVIQGKNQSALSWMYVIQYMFQCICNFAWKALHY